MRYASIRELDISNGDGVGIALFVQGCHFHCKGCFNQETWDFNGGKEWTPEVKRKFLSLLDRDYIKRVSILGGEPLEDCNIDELTDLLLAVKSKRSDAEVWLYTGYTLEQFCKKFVAYTTSTNNFDGGLSFETHFPKLPDYIDYLVAGPFELDKQDIDHRVIKFAGSTNQKIVKIEHRTINDGY